MFGTNFATSEPCDTAIDATSKARRSKRSGGLQITNGASGCYIDVMLKKRNGTPTMGPLVTVPKGLRTKACI